MPLNDLLTPDAILPALRVNSKKQALQEMSARAAALTGLGEREIFDTLLQRERLGSTGVGAGMAIPHSKMAGVNRVFGLMARLERPIDFDALDGQLVDIIFLLLTPEAAGADHLRALSRVARVLRDSATAKTLRATPDAALLYQALCSEQASDAA